MATANGGSAFDVELGSYYWSSTEEAGTHAWLYSFGFSNHSTLMNKESNSFNARAVKDF